MKRSFYCTASIILFWVVDVVAAPLLLETAPVPLSEENPALKIVGKLEYRGGLKLRSENEKFGGLSGLAISLDGSVLRAVTDHGNWVRATPLLDEKDRLVGLRDAHMSPLLASNGVPIRLKYKRDAESLFRVKRGYVTTFEGVHRLLKYQRKQHPLLGPGIPIAAPQHIFDAHFNKGMEAAVALSDGRWVVVAEDFPEDEKTISGWVLQKQRWRPFDYRRTEQFKPVGAALLPSENMLVLERRFSFLGGFASRLAIIPHHTIRPGATLRSQEIARLEPPLVEENFEGAAAYRNKKGETIIFIVSDDNFFSLQSTLLLMFKLRD
jgi:hypothetical protein